MPGFLLQDDAVKARKNVFDEWLDEQKRNAESAAQQVQQTVATATQGVSDEVAQRRQQFDDWLGQQTAAPATPAAPQLAPVPSSAPTPVASAETPEQRRSAFQDWLDQLNQPPVAGSGGAATPSAPPATGPAPITQQPSQPAAPTDNGFAFPVQGYHSRIQNHWGEVLGGSDLFADRGTPVVAMRGGKVLESGWNDVGGNSVLIQGDDGNQYYYAHFDQKPSVGVGETVSAGQFLGPVGNTGDASRTNPHLHIGIGPNIRTGADKYGGTGGDYDAVSLLQRTLDNTAQAPVSSIDGQRLPFDLTPQASDRVRGQAEAIKQAASSTGVPPSVIAAIMDTEGGGPRSVSPAGAMGFMQVMPFHFKPGEDPFDPFTNILRGAQILGDNFSRFGTWAKAAAAYFGAVDAKGNITDARDAGGMTGTGYVSRFQDNLARYGGDVSQALGRASDTLGQASQAVADRAEQLARSSTDLARQTADQAQQALDLLNQTRTRAQAENERWLDQRRADIARTQADILAPRRFDLSMAQNEPANGFLAPGGPVGDYFNRLGAAAQAAGQHALANPLTPLVTPGEWGGALQEQFTSGTPARILAMDREATDAVANAAINRAKEAGANPTPDQEEFVRTALSAFGPSQLPLMLLGGEGALPARLAGGLGLTAASGLGMAGSELAARTVGLPEELVPWATLAGGFLAPVGGALATRGVRAGLSTPEAQALLRTRQRGEAEVGLAMGRPQGPEVPSTRMYHGTGAAFETPDFYANKDLAEAGFDGIRHTGGALVGMADEAGRPITHNVNVIFPESMDKIRNAISMRQGGAADPRLAMQLGTTAAGGALGYATAPEDATQEERMKRAAIGALGAGTLAFGGPRLAQMSPATRAQAQDVATWLRASTPSQATARAVGQALGPQSGGERVAEWISSNLLSGPGLVWNVLNQSMHLGWQPLLRAVEGHPIEGLRGFQATVAAVPEALQRGWAALARGEGYAGVGGQQSRPLARTSVGLRANLAGDAVLRTLNEHLGGMLEAQRLIREAGATTAQAQQAVIAQNAGRIAQVAAAEGNRSALTTGTARMPWLRDLGTLKTSLLRDSNPLKQVAGVLLHVGMPFARVPEEVLYQVVRNSPGIGQLIDALQFVKAAPGDARHQAAAKAALNAAMSAAVIAAALSDQIRGGDDPEHPNSVNVGGQWLPLTSLGTLGGRMAVTMAVIDGLRKQGTEPTTTAMDRIAHAVNNVGRLAQEEYPLAGQIRLLSRIGQGNLTGAASGFASDVLAGLTPVSGALGGAENVVDPYARQAATSGWGDVYEPNLARIPGVANVLPPQVNMLTGEPLRRPSSGPGALLRVQNVGKADSPLAREIVRLERLGYQIGEPKELPTQVSVRGANIKLTPDEQRALAQARGQEIERLIGERIRSGDWATLSDDQKARLIARALNRAGAHNTVTWRRMTPAGEQSERIAQGQRVVGRPVFTAPGRVA